MLKHVIYLSVVQGVGDNENVKKTCTGSPFPDTCISTLSSFNKSKDADARYGRDDGFGDREHH